MKLKNPVRVILIVAILLSAIPSGVFADSAPPLDMFQLPWEQGKAWVSYDGLDNGWRRPSASPHSYKNGGAIDFAPRVNMVVGEDTSNDWVAAAATGTVTQVGSCYVKIDHGNGWITEYWHLDKIQVTAGSMVSRNQRLGIIHNNKNQQVCLGNEYPGPHLHFVFRPKILDTRFAGWTVNYNAFTNRTTYTKNGQTVPILTPLMNIPDMQIVNRGILDWNINYRGSVDAYRRERWSLMLIEDAKFDVTVTPSAIGLAPIIVLLDSDGNEITRASGTLNAIQPSGFYYVEIQSEAGTGFYDMIATKQESGGATVTPSPTSTEYVTPTPSGSETPTATGALTGSETPTPTETPTGSGTPDLTQTSIATTQTAGLETFTPTLTETPLDTFTPTPSATETLPPPPTATDTPFNTETPTPTFSPTPDFSGTLVAGTQTAFAATQTADADSQTATAATLTASAATQTTIAQTEMAGTQTAIAGTQTAIDLTQIAGTQTAIDLTQIAGTQTAIDLTQIAGTQTAIDLTQIAGTQTAIDLTQTAGIPTGTPSATLVSTPTTIPTPTGPYVLVDVIQPRLTFNQTSLVHVSLNNVPVEGYTSTEFVCTYDPAILEVGAILAAELFGSDPATALSGPQNGQFIFAIAGSNGKKATSSATAFTFSVRGLQTGQSTIQCTARVSTGQGSLQPIDYIPDVVTVLDASQSPTPAPPASAFVAGQVIASKPVTIQLFDASNSLVISQAANPDGTFALQVNGGTYTIVASAQGFLNAQGFVPLTNGLTATMQTVSLPAGDIDGNSVIDQFDALTIGMNYNGSFPAAADLNNDGAINVLDLELLAANYRLSGALIWQ
ncbi:MAG: peptidoglycan DD-metalloendopeptidase family protein [Chloroflexi bacterium]|nr:peptidoglycan DD-metalloendopeptidase family protein [Chloroflexota bacterium]